MMKSYQFIIFAVFVFFSNLGISQHTFSIVAVDPATGEVGGAGATCLDIVANNATALIINDLLPGIGAVHTQSYWNDTNQRNASNEMKNGLTPSELMTWLQNNDAQGTPEVRQYGAAAFDSTGITSAAAFTGSECFDDKYHIVGDYYSIQGNILFDSSVIDSMEAFFLRAQGSLSDRLMEAMQGANIKGADVRCFNEGVSSRSAFIRVAKPGDTLGSYYLDLHVPVTPFGIEPINTLQDQYDNWKGINEIAPQINSASSISVYPNPANNYCRIEWKNFNLQEPGILELADFTGRILDTYSFIAPVKSIQTDEFSSGMYILKIRNSSGKIIAFKKLIIN